MKKNIADIIKSVDFKQKLKEAIECGMDEDWRFNGEDEYRVDIFNADDATKCTLELLKKYFL